MESEGGDWIGALILIFWRQEFIHRHSPGWAQLGYTEGYLAGKDD